VNFFTGFVDIKFPIVFGSLGFAVYKHWSDKNPETVSLVVLHQYIILSI
jgi:hypothetical protein